MKSAATKQSQLGKIGVLFAVEGKPTLSGGQKVIWNIIKSLDPEHFSPVLLSQCNCPLTDLARGIGAQVIVLPSPVHGVPPTASRLLHYLRLLSSMPSYIRYFVKVAHILRQQDIRVVWCNNRATLSNVGLVAKVKNIPVVWNVFNNPFRSYTTTMERLYRKFFLWLSHRIVLGHSELKEEAFPNCTIPFDVVYGGVEPPKAVTTRGCIENPVVGTVGVIKPGKRQMDFVMMASALLKRNVNARFQVVGTARNRQERLYEAELKRLVTYLNLEERFDFLGWVDDVYEVISQWSVFVLPSEKEGVPRAILEAMYAHVPVVSTNVGGIPETVVNGDSGILVSVGDSDSLADAVAFLLQHPSEAARLADNALRRVKELFDVGMYKERYERLFEEVVKKKE